MQIRIHDLLKRAVEGGASDIHLASGEIPAFRVHGEIQRLSDMERLTAEESRRLAYSVMNEKQKVIFENEMELDFSFGLKGLARFRVNVFNQRKGIAMVLRQIPTRVLSLEDIKAPSVFKKIAAIHKGLVLVTGPTG